MAGKEERCDAEVLRMSAGISAAVGASIRERGSAVHHLISLGQECKETDRELSKVRNIDHPIPVEIEGGAVVSRIENRSRKQTEIGNVDVPIAINVAVKAEEPLRLAEGVVGAVIELHTAGSDLRGDCSQRVTAVAERSEIGLIAGEIAQRRDRDAIDDARIGREAYGTAADSIECKRAGNRTRESDLSAKGDLQACHARALGGAVVDLRAGHGGRD